MGAILKEDPPELSDRCQGLLRRSSASSGAAWRRTRSSAFRSARDVSVRARCRVECRQRRTDLPAAPVTGRAWDRVWRSLRRAASVLAAGGVFSGSAAAGCSRTADHQAAHVPSRNGTGRAFHAGRQERDLRRGVGRPADRAVYVRDQSPESSPSRCPRPPSGRLATGELAVRSRRPATDRSSSPARWRARRWPAARRASDREAWSRPIGVRTDGSWPWSGRSPAAEHTCEYPVGTALYTAPFWCRTCEFRPMARMSRFSGTRWVETRATWRSSTSAGYGDAVKRLDQHPGRRGAGGREIWFSATQSAGCGRCGRCRRPVRSA